MKRFAVLYFENVKYHRDLNKTRRDIKIQIFEFLQRNVRRTGNVARRLHIS